MPKDPTNKEKEQKPKPKAKRIPLGRRPVTRSQASQDSEMATKSECSYAASAISGVEDSKTLKKKFVEKFDKSKHLKDKAKY